MSRVIRKTAHGRTQLFLNEPNTLFREVKCMGGVVKRDAASVFHNMQASPASEDGACWHCCEPLAAAAAFPIPRLHDHAAQEYHVYGMTCSPACAKAFIIEHTTFDRGYRLNVLSKMMSDVYGIPGTIKEAPPRPALKRFGGMLSPEPVVPRCRMVEPPFVSYSMLVEEHEAEVTELALQPPPPSVVEYLDEPMEEPLFQNFVARRQAGERGPVAPIVRRTAKRQAQVAATGPMAKFVRPSE